MTTNNTNGQTIVSLQEIDVRDVWKNEATDFTPWLAENISLLSSKLGMDIEVIETEKSVGPFHADIYAEDRYGNGVVIENQLEKTDHDHLGKIITYAAGLKSKIMIWVTTEARPEHEMAVNTQNEINSDIKFYLIEVTAHRIGKKEDMKVVVDFRMVCEPNDMTKAIKGKNKLDLIKEERYTKFWTQVKDIDNHGDNILENRTPPPRGYLDVPIIPGSPWTYYVRANTARVELAINSNNEELYESIFLHKDEIESEFGNPMIWGVKTNQKYIRIYSDSDIGGINDEDKWDEIQHDLVDRMSRLRQAIEKYIE